MNNKVNFKYIDELKSKKDVGGLLKEKRKIKDVLTEEIDYLRFIIFLSKHFGNSQKIFLEGKLEEIKKNISNLECKLQEIKEVLNELLTEK